MKRQVWGMVDAQSVKNTLLSNEDMELVVGSRKNIRLDSSGLKPIERTISTMKDLSFLLLVLLLYSLLKLREFSPYCPDLYVCI